MSVNLPDETRLAIKAAAKNCFPREMCGVVLQDNTFVPISNVAEEPTKEFELCICAFMRHRKNTKYIVHSHTSSRYLHICTPSLADMDSQTKWKIPFLIAGFDGTQYTEPFEFPAQRNRDYLNRPYIYGIRDCGILLQDFYHFELDIPVYIDPKLSLSKKKDYAQVIKQILDVNWFKQLDTNIYQKGDILVVSQGGGLANHTVIYLDLTSVLNQNEVSQIEPFSNWKDNIHSAYRHESLC